MKLPEERIEKCTILKAGDLFNEGQESEITGLIISVPAF